MSLWTPGGEIPVNRRRDEPSAPPPPAAGAAGVVGGPSLDDLSPEERAQAEQLMAQMAEVQEQIIATPAAHLVANHLMGLYEVAAIKLSAEPPRFDDAQLAIDAMAGSLELVADRLGEDGLTLREALRQIQMAFVQLRREQGGPRD
ncbi:MAG: hypothetical protein MUF83_12365 [Acidimicrobiales bacterium]|jgi:hypothetical protein|nr:hypothetical protein [Acidimicrobiales bacterium]